MSHNFRSIVISVVPKLFSEDQKRPICKQISNEPWARFSTVNLHFYVILDVKVIFGHSIFMEAKM